MKRIGLLVVLPLLTRGCFGGSSAAPVAAADHLAFTVKVVPWSCSPKAAGGCAVVTGVPIEHRYRLTCRPPGGTFPNPRAACAALGRYATDDHDRGACLGILAAAKVDSRTTITGRYAGRRFHLKLDSDYSWCGKGRATERDDWVLSALPCSVYMLHEGGGKTPEAWARHTGCTIDQE